MRQRQIIKEITETTGCKKVEAQSVIDALIDNINQQLLSDNVVMINHFGSLSTTQYKQREVFIPGKKDLVTILPHRKVQFKISKTLKTEIQGLKKV